MAKSCITHGLATLLHIRARVPTQICQWRTWARAGTISHTCEKLRKVQQRWKRSERRVERERKKKIRNERRSDEHNARHGFLNRSRSICSVISAGNVGTYLYMPCVGIYGVHGVLLRDAYPLVPWVNGSTSSTRLHFARSQFKVHLTKNKTNKHHSIYPGAIFELEFNSSELELFWTLFPNRSEQIRKTFWISFDESGYQDLSEMNRIRSDWILTVFLQKRREMFFGLVPNDSEQKLQRPRCELTVGPRLGQPC